jgi:heterodisulfide reductase subunit A
MTESSQDENLTLYTYAEIDDVKGFVGNYEVTIHKKARSVDIIKCTGCGECKLTCPKKVPNEFDMELGTRKAIYTPFTQAVPNVPVIDRENCLYFTKGKCQLCSKVCPTGAVNYTQEDEIITEKFGAIVVATGFDQFDWRVYGEYGGGQIKNIVTGLHMERMLETSGPTGGHIIRPSDGKEAKVVVFVQCAGSRDEAKGMPYCSRICCMYTAKHALLLKDHQPDSQAYVFYIDIRAGGKNYEEFVKKVQREHGAVYIRGRVSKIYEKGDKLVVCSADTLTGKAVKIEADLVVLATAMVPRTDAMALGQKLNIPYDKYGFYTEVHPKLQPVASVTKGIFLTGASQFPRDIPDTVAMSGAASVGVCGIFSQDEMTIEPRIACVDTDRCTACLNCLQVCPYNAIITQEKNGKNYAYIQESLCSGCGNCASTCRVRANKVHGFTDEQIYAQIKAAFA